jgi:hypothetical protein
VAVRTDVVEAINGAFETDDAEGAPTRASGLATADEREQAARLIDEPLSRSPAIDPAQLARTALVRAYRPGDDWDDMFDRLDADALQQLHDLFPYLPPRAARYFAERFIIPHRY